MLLIDKKLSCVDIKNEKLKKAVHHTHTRT